MLFYLSNLNSNFTLTLGYPITRLWTTRPSALKHCNFLSGVNMALTVSCEHWVECPSNWDFQWMQNVHAFCVISLLEGGNPNARHHEKGLERATFCHGVELSYCLVTVRALTETWYQECEQTLIILLLSICYRSDFLWSCLSVSVESRRSVKHTAWDLRAKTLQNHELNMSEEGAEAAAPAQDQIQGFFTGNIMNFEWPKFDPARRIG